MKGMKPLKLMPCDHAHLSNVDRQDDHAMTIEELPTPGAHGADVSKDEIRDLALNNKPVGALLVIGWNFAKNA